MEVIGVTGGYDVSNSGSSSWSVGEPLIEFQFSQSGSISQGFQQSWDFFVGAIEPEIQTIEIFPNPTHSKVKIRNGAGYSIRLIDMTGKEQSRWLLTNDEESIDLTDLASGIYSILFLSERSGIVGGKKIVKE